MVNKDHLLHKRREMAMLPPATTLGACRKKAATSFGMTEPTISPPPSSVLMQDSWSGLKIAFIARLLRQASEHGTAGTPEQAVARGLITIETASWSSVVHTPVVAGFFCALARLNEQSMDAAQSNVATPRQAATIIGKMRDSEASQKNGA